MLQKGEKGESTVKQAVQEGTLRPYHETVKDMIRRSTNEYLHEVATHIKETAISDPDVIDGIILVWNEKIRAMGWGEDLGVPASLVKQKEALLAKGVIQLAELAVETDGLHSLLHDRQREDPQWISRLREQVYRLDKLFHRLF